MTITVTAYYGDDAGIAADWWVVAIPDYGRYWYYLDGNMQWMAFPGGERNLGLCRPVYRGPLQTFSRPVVLLPATTLPRGTYYIHMAVGPRDGILNPAMLWDIDMLTVIVE